MKRSFIGFIPARAGSLRVKSKNTRILAGHPLLAYTIASALQSGVFERVVVSTDSEETRQIALKYGAEAPFLRPADLATSTSIDVQWIRHAFQELGKHTSGADPEAFAILRPTSPFRSAGTIQRAAKQFFETSGVDSIRAVELCHEHPGKMWKIENERLLPFLDQSQLPVPWHAMQYQELPKVYVQNSSLEMAWSYVVERYNSREGKVIAPFLTEGMEGFSIDYDRDWLLAEALVEKGMAQLPEVKV